jgi:excisionase family DNA binding protein
MDIIEPNVTGRKAGVASKQETEPVGTLIDSDFALTEEQIKACRADGATSEQINPQVKLFRSYYDNRAIRSPDWSKTWHLWWKRYLKRRAWPPLTITIRAACELSGLSRVTINRLIWAKRLRSTHVGAKHLVYFDSLQEVLGLNLPDAA